MRARAYTMPHESTEEKKLNTNNYDVANTFYNAARVDMNFLLPTRATRGVESESNKAIHIEATGDGQRTGCYCLRTARVWGSNQVSFLYVLMLGCHLCASGRHIGVCSIT